MISGKRGFSIEQEGWHSLGVTKVDLPAPFQTFLYSMKSGEIFSCKCSAGDAGGRRKVCCASFHLSPLPTETKKKKQKGRKSLHTLGFGNYPLLSLSDSILLANPSWLSTTKCPVTHRVWSPYSSATLAQEIPQSVHCKRFCHSGWLPEVRANTCSSHTWHQTLTPQPLFHLTNDASKHSVSYKDIKW